jgi:hypothetical protein
MTNDRFASSYRVSKMDEDEFTNVNKVSSSNMECKQLLNSRNLISTSQLGNNTVDKNSIDNLA